MTINATNGAASAAEITMNLLDRWATDMHGPVALTLAQELVSVECRDGSKSIIYPPTYADIGYNIDTLADGTKVALIDSIGSQANRIEPLFKTALSDFVPQIDIVFSEEATANAGEGEIVSRGRSIFDLAHRAADATVQSSPGLAEEIAAAFDTLKNTGNAGPLSAVAPTSLIFGVWDSRGGSGQKRPRLVRAVVRAWDVEPLHAAAQFNSVWKSLSGEQQKVLEAEAKANKVKLSEKGFKDAPAVFRKTDKVEKFRHGVANPDARVLGGILVHGKICREVTVNLVALRGLGGGGDFEASSIRQYLLGLTLLAATADIEMYFREGCHLRHLNPEDLWHEVPRRGNPTPVKLGSKEAQKVIEEYTRKVSEPFKKHWKKDRKPYFFDVKVAKGFIVKDGDEGGDS